MVIGCSTGNEIKQVTGTFMNRQEPRTKVEPTCTFILVFIYVKLYVLLQPVREAAVNSVGTFLLMGVGVDVDVGVGVGVDVGVVVGVGVDVVVATENTPQISTAEPSNSGGWNGSSEEDRSDGRRQIVSVQVNHPFFSRMVTKSKKQMTGC